MKVIRVIILLLFLSALLWIFYCIITLPDLSGLGNKTRTPSISVLDDDRKIIGSSGDVYACLLYTSPSPRDGLLSRMPSSA